MTKQTPDYHVPNAAWSGHHLILADEELVDRKIRRPLLSPSVAAAYNSCPASAALERLMPWDDDPFAANTMGTAAHAVMEDLMLAPSSERTIEGAHDLLSKLADKQWSITKLEKQDDDHLRANAENRKLWEDTISGWVKATFLAIDPPSIEVETTEFRLDNVEIGRGVGAETGIPLKGFVDLTEWVIRDGRRLRLIDDWKFGKPKVKVNPRYSDSYSDSYGDQQRIYYAGYTEKTGEVPAGARLIFPRGLVGLDVDPQTLSRKQREVLTIRNIDVSQDAVRQTLLGFRAGWNTMNDSCDRRMFEARPSPLCSWCPAANSCPVARLGRKPNAVEAASKQPSALQLGIPVLRPGASVQDVREAPGVTVPTRREPDHDAVIEPQGDDLFPITLIEGADDSLSAPVGEPSAEAGIPDEAVPEDNGDEADIASAVDAVLSAPTTFVSAGDPFGAELLGTVHVQEEGTTVHEGEPIMTDQPYPEQPLQVKPEAQPFEPTINGALNLNSYSAMAVCGLVALAFEHMRSQNVKVGPASLSKFSRVLSGIVLRVQKRTTGYTNYQAGSNTRLRGFLHMALDAFPAPFRVPSADGTAQVPATVSDWQQWTARIENLMTVSLTTAIDLYDTASIEAHTGAETYFAAGGEGAPAPVAADNLTPTN